LYAQFPSRFAAFFQPIIRQGDNHISVFTEQARLHKEPKHLKTMSSGSLLYVATSHFRSFCTFTESIIKSLDLYSLTFQDSRIRWDSDDEGWVGGGYLDKGEEDNSPINSQLIPLLLDKEETHYK
jgi:hypothetical protein